MFLVFIFHGQESPVLKAEKAAQDASFY